MRETAAVIVMNLSSLRSRLGASLVIVVAIAVLAGISTALLSATFGELGARDTMKQADLALVLSAEAQYEFQSSIDRAASLKIADAPGVKRGKDGAPLVFSEVLGYVPVVTRDDQDVNLAVRGSSPLLFEMRPEYKIVEGRMYKPGLHELIVGREPQKAYPGLAIGDKVRLPDDEWTIVGVFESHGRGDWMLYGDVEAMMPAFHRNAFHSTTVQLESPAAFDAFKAALTVDPTLGVRAERVNDYWDRAFEGQISFYEEIAVIVGSIIALAVVFASTNMMYVAVSRRVGEIATLRAIGFGTTAVVASVLAECLVLAAIGAAAGIFAAWAGCDGVNFVAGGFHLRVTPTLILMSALGTFGVGVLAALFPAIRAARLPVATALQVR